MISYEERNYLETSLSPSRGYEVCQSNIHSGSRRRVVVPRRLVTHYTAQKKQIGHKFFTRTACSNRSVFLEKGRGLPLLLPNLSLPKSSYVDGLPLSSSLRQ